MACILAVFALVFLLRDAQILALRDRVNVTSRLVVYGALQIVAIMLVAWLTESGSNPVQAWTNRRFALVCVLIQVAELGIAWTLRNIRAGRFSWIGWMLPSPVLLAALLGLSFALQKGLLLSPVAAMQTVALLWLSLVYAASVLLIRVGEASEDAVFAGDFALLTGCTALIFVPAAGFS
jgi:hypothetical protein